jgi:ornithine--oxo-acid transaminase
MLHLGVENMKNRATTAAVALEDQVLTHNYHPLPVVARRARGAWVWDVEGTQYLDCLAAYSAVNFGHGHPAILRAARRQLRRVTLTSRAFHNDQLGPFARELAALLDMDMVLPMNSGAEAVESAIKIARAWGYRVKGVPEGRATIIVAENNFHGRTISLVSFSTDPTARADFGPFTPGFITVPFGDADALEAAIDDTVVAVLLEPIQGEAGIIVPPEGYLKRVREITTLHSVVMIADEIQSGLGRTGALVQCHNENVQPDIFILGKALGGGVLPVSAVVGKREFMGVLKPGQHGSTFGGNPLAAAVGLAVVRVLAKGHMQRRSQKLGKHLHLALRGLLGKGVLAVRGVGLWAGIDIDPELATGREVCEALMHKGVLAKDTHGSTIRLAPPLVVSKKDLDWAVRQLEGVLIEMAEKKSQDPLGK